MGYQTITHIITLSLQQVIDLLIFDRMVSTTNENGETLVLIGSGTHKKVPAPDGLGISHRFFTSVMYQEEYLWTTVTLTSKDSQIFNGSISYQVYSDSSQN